MADEPDFPRDVGDGVDPKELDRVARTLGELDFLHPDRVEDSAEQMPDWVWTRLQDALAAEGATSSSRRPSRIVRWGGGLVAASVAVVALGLAVTTFQGDSTDGAIVAGDAATSQESAELPGEAPGVAEALAAPEADVLAQPGMMSFAGMVPPALRLVDSQTDYTPSSLRAQVSDVLEQVGVMPTSAEQVMEPAPAEMAMPDVPVDGFLSSPESLRDCITKLTTWSTSTALMVDRSSFEGQDASVVVAPHYAAADRGPDMGDLQVWVIDRDCDVRMKVSLRVAR